LVLVAQFGDDVEPHGCRGAWLEVDLGRQPAADHLPVLDEDHVRDRLESYPEVVGVVNEGADHHLEAAPGTGRIEPLDARLAGDQLEDGRDDIGDLLRAPDLGTWRAGAEQRQRNQQHEIGSRAWGTLHPASLPAGAEMFCGPRGPRLSAATGSVAGAAPTRAVARTAPAPRR